jgi:molybdate transport system substrate-binding protein
VTFNYGATTQLRTQLEQGARADLFASANRQQMDVALKSGSVTGEAALFAQNNLVVITPRVGPTAVAALEDLARPGVKLVITQADVPVGVYARDALRKMAADPRFGAEYERNVLANVVSEEANVKQLIAKVQLGEADAAFVYSSDVSAAVGPQVNRIDVPDAFNTVADYPIAVVKESREPELARAFVAYLVTGPGRTLLQKHGFLIPGATAAGRLALHG